MKYKIGLLILFILLSIFVFFNPKNAMDLEIAKFFYNIRNDFLTGFFKFITTMGYIPGYIFALVVLAIIFIRKNNYLKIILPYLALAISVLLNNVVKLIISRDRPNPLYWLMDEDSKSFPSGHTMNITCFCGMLMYLNYISNLKYKKTYMALLSVFIVLVGISRMYIGVHYFTDIIGGLLFGSLVALVSINVYEWGLKHGKKKCKEN